MSSTFDHCPIRRDFKVILNSAGVNPTGFNQMRQSFFLAGLILWQAQLTNRKQAPRGARQPSVCAKNREPPSGTSRGASDTLWA